MADRAPMRSRAPLLLAVAAAVALITGGAGAQTLDEQTAFKKGRYAYAAKSFDDADAMFRAMLDPRTGLLHDKVLVNEARMYWGATLIARGRKEEAMAQFDALLSSDPKYEPDPTVFPLEVGKAFIDAQAAYKKRLIEAEEEAKLREKLRREQEEAAKKAQIERMRRLETLATEEHVVDHHSRWIALVPFGIGQFQNGKGGLGWFFLSSESLFLAGAIVTVPIYLTQLHNASAAYSTPQDRPIAQAYQDRANAARYTNLALNGVFAVLVAAGIIEAELDYVPDVTTVKPRNLPDLPGVSPAAQPSARITFGAVPILGDGRGGGLVLGVGGEF